nr:YwiC-like family protein [Phytoactinopolyspora halotolerans]
MIRRYLPPQHGAWAMLAVPHLAGVLVAGWSWPAAPLAGAWLSGYLLSYYVFLAVKTRRPSRWHQQMVVYAAVATPLAAVVTVARPAVLWYAPLYALLLAINAWYAWRRHERALLNDLASVVQSCLMVFLVAAVARVDVAEVAGVFVACAVYFAGTAVYVKTMIRERGRRGYRYASAGYHLAALAAMSWYGPAMAGMFGLLLVRAAVLPGHGLTPKQVGLIELVLSAFLLVAIVFTFA